MRPLLRLRNVESRYGAFVALQHVSLVVPQGSVVALLGPNGVGKTTLLRTVSGMMSPWSGEITFDGVRIDDKSDHDWRRAATRSPERCRVASNRCCRLRARSSRGRAY